MTSIQLVIFDWAGTTVDHGSVAPVVAFVRAFAEHRIELTTAEARVPMGLHKEDHIRALLRLPTVAARWRRVHGREASEADVAMLYQCFVPLQTEAVDSRNCLVPHLLPVVDLLRRRGLRIGATTGYFRAAAERVYAAARAQGYQPDATICAEDVSAGRPAPWMMFCVMEMLNVYPPSTVVKVGDTVPDIEEALSAGAWSVGVLQTGSEVGCTEEEWQALPDVQRRERLTAAASKLQAAGAHATLQTLAELPACIDDFSQRLRRGEKP